MIIINDYIENKDYGDVLKTLVFVAGYKTSINREHKKLIVDTMRLFYDEDFSLFRDENKINAI